MKFFTNIFKKSPPIKSYPPELEKLFDIYEAFKLQFLIPEYISRKDYLDLKTSFLTLKEYFVSIIKEDLFRSYCEKNSVEYTKTLSIFNQLDQMDRFVDEHNEKYIQQERINLKEYLDHILKEIDENILLDNNQREVVISDEDYSLVIAGAGAGKTTTIAAKVKYLVEKKNIDTSQILVISFTNKAVEELKERINKNLGLDCPITTFHSAGNAILRKHLDNDQIIVQPGTMYFVLQEYFKKSVLLNERMVNNIILFFSLYLNSPPTGDDLKEFFKTVATGRYDTLRSSLGEYIEEVINIRTKKHHSITNELLRSQEEVQIANFFYLNQIDYQYEPVYPFKIANSLKPYTPDFLIKQGDHIAYVEHFGISQNGESNRYSNEELNSYKKAIQSKIKIHEKHNTKLITTYSQYNDGRPLIDHLKEDLENNGFLIRPRSKKEVLEKLVHSEQSSYIHQLIDLICRFLSNFKANAYSLEDFSRMVDSTTSVRSKLFLDICKECFLEYERFLSENNALDFDDMINESARILREVSDMKQQLNFRYIIVDEYQDISKQRYDLTTELSKVTDAKIIAVGDDWQSIYAFSGSDIELFTEFEKKMGYAKVMQIVNTYRNAQEVIDIAGNFVQENPAQIRKRLRSPKNINDPVIIYTYDNSRKKSSSKNTRTGANYAMAQAVEKAIEQILFYNKLENKPENSNILLLGRFNFDGDLLEKSGLFEFRTHRSKIHSVKYPRLDITFMTTHSSKGLGYDNVIIINGKNEQYGFPSKIQNDPVLNFVTKRDLSIEYAEERRLFYVAMTRTKNRVFCIAPEKNPSEFLLELKRNYTSVKLQGEWNEELNDHDQNQKRCPICNFPLQYRFKKSIGLPLFICTNEPEICGFLTNDLKGEKMSIQKCKKCIDGYLIVKSSADNTRDPFLGCTNYAKNGTGCNNTISKAEYYHLFDKKSLFKPSSNYVDKNVQIEDINEKNLLEYDPANNLSDSLSTDSMDLELKKEALQQHSKPIPRKNKPQNIYYNEVNLIDLIGIVLEAVDEISQIHFFGITITTAVLKEYKNKKIQEYRLDKLNAYGRLKHIDHDTIETTLRWLIENDYLLQRKGLYPVLHMTHKGNHYKELITTPQLKSLLNILQKDLDHNDL
ncbi:MAG: UvrD-helicase domain-containing protein [Peptostreptococcaceae bacterium]|nr:UvrD-helicase domain-containing protein [Peptostreptococcaceae bacterium]